MLIVSSNEQGIGNRLKCLVSAMLASEELNTDLLIYWPLNDLCQCKITDLFENNFRTLNFDEFKKIKKSKEVIDVNTWRLIALKESNPEYIDFKLKEYTSDFKPNEIGYIDFKYNEIPSEKKHKFGYVFKKLRFHESILKEVNSIENEVLNSGIALCIRTWHEASERSILFNPENIERIIENSKGKIFMSCDSEKYMDELIHKYSDKIIFYSKRTKSGDRMSTIGMQDILVDMKLISLCKRIYVPYISTFPEIAWWLGGCNAEVIPIETPEQIAYYNLTTNNKYIKAEIDSIQNGQKSFNYYFKIIIRKLIRRFGL